MTKRYIKLIILLFIVSCGDSGAGGCAGCDGLAPVPYPDPPPAGGEILPDVVRAHLTEDLLGFFETHLNSLLTPALTIEEGQARFYLNDLPLPADIPVTFRENSYLFFNPENLNNSLTLTWLPLLNAPPSTPPIPGGIRVTIDELELYTSMVLVLSEIEGVLPSAACKVESSFPHRPALRIHNISMDIAFSIDEEGGESRLKVTPSGITFDFDTDSHGAIVNMEVTPCDGRDQSCLDPLCTEADADCRQVCGLFNTATSLGNFLLKLVEPLMGTLGTTLESSLAEVLSETLAELPLGLEAQISVEALAGPLFGGAEDVQLKISAADNFGVSGLGPARGLGLGLDGGFTAQARALCAQGYSPPDFSAISGAPPVFSSFIELLDENGDFSFARYHLALSASSALLSQAAFGLFNAGLLCLDFGTNDVTTLTDGEFSLTAGLLSNFERGLDGVADDDAPVLMRIAAQSPPEIRIGQTGTEDPLLEVTLDDLQVDIHMMIDDAQFRVVGLLSDITIAMALVRTADNKIQLVIDKIAASNTTQVYNELAPNADLTGLFEFMVQFAVDTLLTDELSFDLDFTDTLSDATGIPVSMKIATIRRDEGATGVPYLSAYLKLCSDEDLKNSDDLICSSPVEPPLDSSEDVSLDPEASFYREAPERPSFPERWWAEPNGEILFQVGGEAPREFQMRVDRGAWSSFKRPHQGTLRFYNARLKLLGSHSVEVRERRPNQPVGEGGRSVFPVLIDPEPPRVHLYLRDGQVHADVDERVTPDAVELLWRLRDEAGAGPWRPMGWSVPLPETAGVMEVLARDLAGNESRIETLDLEAHPVSLIEAPPASPQGCSGGPAPLVILPGLLASLLVSVRRRRR